MIVKESSNFRKYLNHMFPSTISFVINSPLEQFEVVSFINITAPIFGYFNLALTNLGLYSIIVLFIVLGFLFKIAAAPLHN